MEYTIDTLKGMIQRQFPQYAHLEIKPVKKSGHDNRTFHLGDDLSIRIPSAKAYEASVLKEYTFLPVIASGLSLPIPRPHHIGKPDVDVPFSWLINSWLQGETVNASNIDSMHDFALDCAAFLRELRAIESHDACPSGDHNFHRGGHLSAYHDATLSYIEHMSSVYNREVLLKLWYEGLNTPYLDAAVWVHGDFAVGNILVKHGKLSGVIDFGSSATGDPACDTVLAWTFFDKKHRQVFLDALAIDEAMIKRAKAWVLWKGLFTLVVQSDNVELCQWAQRCIEALLEA